MGKKISIWKLLYVFCRSSKVLNIVRERLKNDIFLSNIVCVRNFLLKKLEEKLLTNIRKALMGLEGVHAARKNSTAFAKKRQPRDQKANPA